ncbi:MAG: DUF4142 domain-containing protein [Chitinophagaceae bacterium]|nr:MAG: DUF4142 domain-containing protein [Chitinophagaceae bacterium]
MKYLVILTIFGASIAMLCSCSSRRKSENPDRPERTGITGLTPTTGRPSTAVIRASGDELTPGVNPHNRTTGSSRENATAIANNAINRANSESNAMMLRLDTITGTAFISRFSASNERQMKITTLAGKEGENQKIKDYAAMIMKDHQQLQTDLNKLSRNTGIDQESLIVTRLQPLNPKAQHRNTTEYIQLTIEDHQNMIRLLEAASRSTNAPLKTFAAKYLPVLKKHLSAAQDLTVK